MLILKPDITVYWDKEVSLAAFSYLYMDTHSEAELKTRTVSNNGDVAIPIEVTISEGILTIRDEHLLKHIPRILPLLKEWVTTYDLHQKWLEEQSIYNNLMDSVHLPDADISKGYRTAWFSLRMVPLGVLPIVVTVAVYSTKPQALVQLQLDTGETDNDWDPVLCTISSYYLDFPITMDALKASMCKPFQQYLDYLQG